MYVKTKDKTRQEERKQNMKTDNRPAKIRQTQKADRKIEKPE
jgi:hypothetical protein